MRTAAIRIRIGIVATLSLVATSGVVAISALSAQAVEPIASPSAAASEAAGRGAAWLARLVTADGFVPKAGDPATPSFGATRDVAVALATAGTEPTTFAKVVDFLAMHLSDAAADLTDSSGADKPGPVGQLIMVAVAAGRDPRAFGGTAPINDLVARLLATRRLSGPDAGLFGSQFALYDGAYRQGLALAALRAVGVIDTAGSAWLEAQQCADGSWMAYRSDLGAPCAFDPESFTGPDTNSTALAAIGLVAACRTPLVDVAAYFAESQTSNGGWSFGGSPGEDSDPNSTALVMSALVSLHVDPNADPFADPNTPSSALIGFQFADGPDAGAFWFPPFDDGPRTPNLLATAQASIALLLRSFPLARPAGTPPVADPCGTSGPTSTTSTSSTSTAPTSTSSTSTSSTSTAPTTTPTIVSVRAATVERAEPAAAATAVRGVVQFAG